MNLSAILALQFNLPVAITLLVCVGVSGLAHWVSRQPQFPGRMTFVFIHLASLWWMLAAALELASIVPERKIFWASMAWPGIVATPTIWMLFLWQYVNSSDRSPAKPILVALTLAPLLFWFAALTNPSHQLFYSPGTAPLSDEVGAPIRYLHGPLFYAAAVYVYICMLFALALVIRAALGHRGLYRRHYLAFVAVTTLPWAANISYVVFGKTIFGFDPTPFSFAFTLVAFAWLIMGVRLFDILPIARHLLLEALPDPVVVVDRQQRVIDANPAALALAGSPAKWQGQALTELPLLGAALSKLLASEIAGDTLELFTLNDGHYYELTLSPIIRKRSGEPLLLGSILYLRDVTQRHLSERKLSEALALSEERLKTISSLHELLREQALRDPLTGLYNRRYLNEFFAHEIARAHRHQNPIAVALIDLDHFKQLNDTHGHLVGDDILKAVAKFLLDNLRISDAVFRIGGEEFLLVLPGVVAEDALNRLQKMCSDFATTAMHHRNGELLLTFSAGLALWPADGDSLDTLIEGADSALYQAKAAGRNRVHLYRDATNNQSSI
ncbi:histidine kinase N-terminal 7TM domain-containing protein [Cellvibrio sp. NN19]|uniref:histidine kinase N-terminal 7TM domain-containing diguanylate cyclase n=1 Tax=Cellvibrio chitinivorans TaxID=3102792 RepID=UPI002B4139DA|nr:histidine kinase N-terminal 7TM domain-containing protein [Cellvibrio sp. NN19]